MSHTQKSWRPSHTRCARRSLVELTAAASRAVDDGLFVLSSGIAVSNPRSERTGEKTSDQTILARQATGPSPVAGLESRHAAAPRKDELLDSDTTTEIMVKIAKVYQNRAFENIKASLNAALDPAKDLVETRAGGEAASKDIGGCNSQKQSFDRSQRSRNGVPRGCGRIEGAEGTSRERRAATTAIHAAAH